MVAKSTRKEVERAAAATAAAWAVVRVGVVREAAREAATNLVS